MELFSGKAIIGKLGLSSLLAISCLCSLPITAKAQPNLNELNWRVVEVDEGPHSENLEASQLFSTALAFYYDRNLRAAAIALQQALSFDPNIAKAHYLLGNVYYQLDRREDAMVEYQQALTLNPFLVKAHINLGAALVEQGDYADAVAQYEQALEIEPQNAIATFNLGVALIRLEQAEQGILLLNNAQQLFARAGDRAQAEEVNRFIQCDVLSFAYNQRAERAPACR